ncbi:UBX domain-containing protein 11 isoform X1 [Sorex fumeus]|uniref:UBX domain-containing protein 11 isoform X1 n=2 Tax=Sorex fumeus TaxID=62283 RepID=UPI0024AE8639|nr:UBX domain-containing protein 11 isoform X1 [Sorex fumeus]
MSSPLASLGDEALKSTVLDSVCLSVPMDQNSEAMGNMVKNLRELEWRVKIQSEELLNKDKKIKALEELVETLQGSPAAYKQRELETTCRKLQKQVAEMERFLADYGLLWVGEPSDHKDSEDSERDWMTTMKFWKPGNSLAPPEVDFDRLLVCLKDLSELVAEGETQVVPVSGGARFRTLEPIPLKLYRNGLIMFDGPFRPFHEPATQRCLRDILDGFFPSELRRLYPNGVPFKVSDLRHQVYPENGLDPFPGEGRVVGQKIHKIVDRPENADSRLTPEKFLKRLPKVVIRQGEVVDIRGPIRDTLQNYCSLSAPVPEILVETPALAAERQRSQEWPESSPPQQSLLRIKSEDGEKVFRLMMQPQDTIGDVHGLLAKARNQDAGTFEIFSTFPPVVYDDHSVTLQDAGLVPNAMLLLRPPRPPPGPHTTNPRPLPGP